LLYEYNDYVVLDDNDLDCDATVIPKEYRYSANMTIPDNVRRKRRVFPITRIGSYAFYGHDELKTVTLSNSIRVIEDKAFRKCSSLTSILIPRNVWHIGETAFAETPSIESIYVDSANVKFDSRDNCNAIIDTKTNTLIVGCKNTRIPNTVTTIGDRAFRGCKNLLSIEIPISVDSIGWGAFYGCDSLSKIQIYNPVPPTLGQQFLDTIVHNVFSFSSTYITCIVPYGSLSAYQHSEWANYKIAFVEANLAFNQMQYTTLNNSIVNPQNMQEKIIFNSNKNGKGVITFSNMVTSIGDSAFNECYNLTSASFSKCKSIGTSAFAYCSKLSTIDLPLCQPIGGYACQGCSSLNTANFPSCTSLGASAFISCSQLTEINFPVCASVGTCTFSGCSQLLTAAFPECTYVASYAFRYCSQLSEINLSKCTSMGYSAFEHCESLTTISLPTCQIVGNYAFNYCIALSTISLPVCSSIGAYAFSNCNQLSKIYLGASSVCSITTSSVFCYTKIGSKSGSIFVPSSLVATYKTAKAWSFFSNRIYSM
jgi:hypothetical protein